MDLNPLVTQQKLLTGEAVDPEAHVCTWQATPAWGLLPRPPCCAPQGLHTPQVSRPPVKHLCSPLSFSILLDEEGHIKITGL